MREVKLCHSLDEGRTNSKPASQGAAGDLVVGLGTADMFNDMMLCEELFQFQTDGANVIGKDG